MSRTRVKICGLTRVEDALLACELGADAIGIVMTPSSPRCVSIERAREIRAALPPFVSVVSVVVDPQAVQLERIISKVRPHLMQFHGNEPRDFCAESGMPYIKAFSMNELRDDQILDRMKQYADAAAVLLDGRAGARLESRGFDWSRISAAWPLPVILAGEINEANVAAAIRQVAPYALDVSSGVESSPGIKDRSKMERFFRNLARADLDHGGVTDVAST